MAVENPPTKRDFVPFDYLYFARLLKSFETQNLQYSRVGLKTKVSSYIEHTGLILSRNRTGIGILSTRQ